MVYIISTTIKYMVSLRAADDMATNLAVWEHSTVDMFGTCYVFPCRIHDSPPTLYAIFVQQSIKMRT